MSIHQSHHIRVTVLLVLRNGGDQLLMLFWRLGEDLSDEELLTRTKGERGLTARGQLQRRGSELDWSRTHLARFSC